MKWESGSDEGIVVAGGNGAGSALNQLDHPTDLFLVLTVTCTFQINLHTGL